MLPKVEVFPSVETTNGEETRIKDVKVEESGDADHVAACKTTIIKKESEELEETISTITKTHHTTSKREVCARRNTEINIPQSTLKALIPNSNSLPQIHNSNVTVTKTVANPVSVKTSNLVGKLPSNSAGIVSSKNITHAEEKTEERKNIDLSNPHDLLLSLLRESGYKAHTRNAKTVPDFFLELKTEHIEAYNTEIVKAVRDRNIPLLRAMHAKGKTLQCSNRFGESLLHMACRRGYTDVVRFLIKEANVTLRVKDDFGRTPLHDACWSASPNFDLMELIIEHDPDLLLIEDVRGHSPFSYARQSHWPDWKDFLTARRETLRLNTFID